LNKKIIFFSLTVLITTIFSLFANDPPEVVIIGPEFHEQQYFVEELNIIANELGIKIKYELVSDAETFIIDNPNSSSSIAIIPNPQGVVNLAERKLIYSLDDVLVDNNSIFNLYPNHLISIVSHEDSIYGGWTRLFPNSLIWYDISKFEQHNVKFDSFETLLESTKKIADNGTSPWCANSESAASTGWVQTNWMEDVLLTKYGPKVYDEWSKLKINASNVKIFLSIKHIEDFIFYDNHIYNGPGSITDKEFRNLPKVLLDDSTECFMSWSGHYFRYYIPEDYRYLRDFAVTNVPKINFENSVVGIGDNIVLTKDNELSKIVISKILSKNFGEIWSSYQDTEFISANQNFNKQIINNELTKFEYSIVHDALQKDLFRYDASEIMARSIGSNLLWELFREYIREGPQNLVKLLNQLDREI
jgi:alpha-glucoside transport system substrate-binding protein